MSQRFQTGLVVGKFSPLHRGHELVIRRALVECATVVAISYSKPELPGCGAAQRERWLAGLFPEVRRLVVTDDTLPPSTDWSSGVPSNDAPAQIHRQFCAHLCSQVLGVTPDAVFTSEDYGNGFAVELTRCFRNCAPECPVVQHVSVDRERHQCPASGTMLRQDIHRYRQWLAPFVYAAFVKRACLLGGESTGKSTLSAALAAELGTVHAAEYGRDLWEARRGALVFEDMCHIAEVQIQREEQALLRANRLVFCDTSPLTTLFYCQYLFGRVEPALAKMADRLYDFTFLCAPDFPFVQDGTRQPEVFRLRQHEWYLAELTQRRIPYRILSGSLPERIAQVRDALGLRS